MREVHVFATIKPKPDHYSEVLHILQGIVAETRREDGCRRFELNTGIDDDHHLYLVEIWDSEAALAAHHDMQHTVAAAKRIDGRLLANTEVIRMRSMTSSETARDPVMGLSAPEDVLK